MADIMANPAVLGRWQQTCLDAYTAQHVGAATPRVTTFFALNTLYLVLELSYTGLQGREAHGYLANTYGSDKWPHLTPPPTTGTTTVCDVAMADTADERGVRIRAWGQSVWDAWSHAHDDVRRATDGLLGEWRPTT